MHSPPRLLPFALSYTAIILAFIVLVYVVVTMQAAVRGYIGGEGLWSKAQKQAVSCLQRYAVTASPREYECYERHIAVPLWDRIGREELQKERYDPALVRRAFEAGGIHPDDVDGMVRLFRYFGGVGELKAAINVWERGDAEIEVLRGLAAQLDTLIRAGGRAGDARVEPVLRELRANDARLTRLEDEFSRTLGVGARKIRSVLIVVTIVVGALLGVIAILFAERWIRTWREAQQQTQEYAARMHAVAGAAAGIVNASSVDELGSVLRDAASDVITYDTFLFAVYDEREHAFQFLSGYADGAYIAPSTVAAAGTPAERFLYDRRPQLTTHAADPRSAGATLVGSDRRSESVIRCAIHSGSRLLGMVSVQSYTPERYSHEDVEVLDTLASMAAVAFERIENARERVLAEHSLRESEERYRQLVEMSPDAVIVQVDGRIAFANSMGARFLAAQSADALVGRDLLEFVHPLSQPGMRRRFAAMLESGDAVPRLEEMFLRVDGSLAAGEVSAQPFVFRNRPAIQLVVRDVTERHRTEEALRRSEQQLRQAQKMEAVGLLAGGVAHDFNNLLTAIRGHAELLTADMRLPESLREHGVEIAAAADRAAALTRQLLAFSRRQVMQPRIVDLNILVENVKSLIGRVVGENVQLITSLEPELGHVRADPHQMEQVLLNLVLNAKDAMPQGGSLIIETCNVDVDAPLPDMPSVRTGSYVRLSVQDSGIGMSEESRVRIFEPFYTTKEVGKGTGLGLSTVYGIVKQSDGHIYARSAPGEGTNMEIFLPRIFEPLDPPLAEPAAHDAVPRRGATVLVVEDEPSVRALVSRVLRREGYHVLQTENGEQALRLLREQPDVDLLLTDMVMPGMSGVALAEQATALRSDLAVIYMSGYTEDEVFRRGMERGTQVFLQKPFTAAALLDVISNALAHV